jgi:uncharacterized cupin superfamily protein
MGLKEPRHRLQMIHQRPHPGTTFLPEPEMSDLDILCEHRPSPAKLEVLGVDSWPLWKKEVSTFPWRYDRSETCYVVRGRFLVTPEGGGAAREFGRGDLITFPAGLSCTWEILEPVEKHYSSE